MITYVQQAQRVIEEVKKVIVGKDACIYKVMAAILAGGHVLIEDVPGVGKTEMALAFSRAMNLEQNRVQFTPDVLPADIVGFSMYQKNTGQFIYQPGAVMCNLLLADEINRTSPKTQSALLEVMEEGNVTVDGVTRKVPSPFIVLATQNPVGSSGTQRLPESQMDRFMICISLGYPSVEAEVQLLKDRHRLNPIQQVQSVIHAQDLLHICEDVKHVFIHDIMYDYIVRLADATRKNPMLELGMSPRGALALCNMSKALAYLEGREYISPRDVKNAFTDVAVHRVRRNTRAKVSDMSAEEIIKQILRDVQEPVPGRNTTKSR